MNAPFDFTSATFVSTPTPLADNHEPALWFLVQGDQLLVNAVADKPAILLQGSPAELGLTLVSQQMLGYLQDEQGQRLACWSANIAAGAVEDAGLVAEGLRQIHARVGDFWFGLAGRAVQIVEWDRTHQYCGRCGAATEAMHNERARRCPVCGLSNYPRLAPAVIVAVMRNDGDGPRILLARNHRFPAGRYSVVAGFVEPGESLEECVQREVREEVGVRVTNLRYFASQPWPFPHSLMVGFLADYAGGEIVLEEAEIAEAQWFAADNLPLLPPKMSIARRLIDWFVEESCHVNHVNQL